MRHDFSLHHLSPSFGSAIRLRSLLVVLALVLTACGSAPVEVVLPTQDEVETRFIADGLTAEVAECVVGLGTRQFDLADIDPLAEANDRTAAAVDEFVSACERARALMDHVEEGPQDRTFAGPMKYGDDTRLDGLWDACHEGDGISCDELWQIAPIDSAYELFGITCGDRPQLLDCTTLGANTVSLD